MLAVTAEAATFTSFKGADIATSYPIMVATLAIYGPTAAALIGTLTVVSAMALVWRDERLELLKTTFNLSQSLVADLAAGWTYVGLVALLARGLSPAIGLQSEFARWPQLVVPILIATIVVVALNVALVVTAMWFLSGTSPALALREVGIGVFVTVHLALALVGLAVALIVVSFNWIGLVVFAFPLLAARQIFQNSARLHEDYPATVRILVRSIEAKDEYTRGHSERVADYAERFCEHLGLSQSRAKRIEFAAMLHDLGKMGVRAEVLNKPAGLTDAEYQEMKCHPVAALEIVSKIPNTDDLLPVIRHHHERPDGNGYPDGIRGDDIPFGSRVLAVCDTFDAMTSSRPYRPALSQEEALGELRSAAGSQLDAELSLEFVEMIESAEGGDQG